MGIKIFVLMVSLAILMCFFTWLFVFKDLRIPGIEVLSSAIYLLVIASFIILSLQT